MKPKAKKSKKRTHDPAPWDPDYDTDDDYDEFHEYEPELFMADPRDRDIAAVMYGEHARWNPAYFDHA